VRRPLGSRGPWRVTVAEGSMRPTIEPGDWLLVDPTTRRWPRRGSIVVFREPGTDVLAIKRVAARPGDWVPFGDGWLQMGDDEAWLLGDAADEDLAAEGFGAAVDSRRYGPVTLDALRGRAWFRYGPVRRVGRLATGPHDLLDRGRLASMPTATD
jgi:signal peptidase I